MDILLPGRNNHDYEAESALRTLLEAKKILHSGDEDLFSRIRELIDYNQSCLSRVDALLGDTKDGGDSLFPEDSTGSTRPDSRTVEDFWARLRVSTAKEKAKNLVPIGGKY